MEEHFDNDSYTDQEKHSDKTLVYDKENAADIIRSSAEYLDTAKLSINKACEFENDDIDNLVVLARTCFSFGKEDEARSNLKIAVAKARENFKAVSSLYETVEDKAQEAIRI